MKQNNVCIKRKGKQGSRDTEEKKILSLILSHWKIYLLETSKINMFL